jgi:rhodanese-related sulfurtransferase
VVVCLRGKRSAQAVLQLRGAGFQRAKRLRGGLEAWQRDVAFALSKD